MSAAKKVRQNAIAKNYDSFNQLDGNHPWMKKVPSGFVSYRVRELNKGKVTYFNFALAKEMGLIPVNHPNHLNTSLESKLIQTFSIQIINEYDELNRKRIPAESIKQNKYMASRYLQLQHQNKQGKTSGDGRGIWNGIVEHKGKVWDVSSRGTGVTCLAPGSVEANRPLQTGDESFGYGCGLAEIDELYASAIQAEIVHLQGIITERVLCVVEIGDGVGIGVRAAPNLLRPAHIFPYLKQNRLPELKNAIDYFIDRQVQNKRWAYRTKGPGKYQDLGIYICEQFSRFAAQLEIDYIFAWLDWDGDNVLAEAGIIDYGSIRQFGLRHDQYRYDDVTRFSTNLSEQWLKARLTLQVFLQCIDYITTGQKKPLKSFSHHALINVFNERFKLYKSDRLLYRAGFSESERHLLMQDRALVDSFEKEYFYFEKAKISGSIQKVSDGINHPPLFNMRKGLKELASTLLTESADTQTRFFENILSGFATKKDLKATAKHQGHIQNLIRIYRKMVDVSKAKPSKLKSRSEILNSEERITGNALIQIVEQIIQFAKPGHKLNFIQDSIDEIINKNLGYPEVKVEEKWYRKPEKPLPAKVSTSIIKLVRDNYEEI